MFVTVLPDAKAGKIATPTNIIKNNATAATAFEELSKRKPDLFILGLCFKAKKLPSPAVHKWPNHGQK
jgi:hypothetical protein